MIKILSIKVEDWHNWYSENGIKISFSLSESSQEEKFRIINSLLKWRGVDDIDFVFDKNKDIVDVKMNECNDKEIQQTNFKNAKNFIKNYREIDSILYSTSGYHSYISFLAELFLYVDPEQIKKLQI